MRKSKYLPIYVEWIYLFHLHLCILVVPLSVYHLNIYLFEISLSWCKLIIKTLLTTTYHQLWDTLSCNLSMLWNGFSNNELGRLETYRNFSKSQDHCYTWNFLLCNFNYRNVYKLFDPLHSMMCRNNSSQHFLISTRH